MIQAEQTITMAGLTDACIIDYHCETIMKLTWLITSVFLAFSALAQTGPALPTSLPQLANILPSLVHGKTFQPWPFSDAMDAALRKARPQQSRLLRSAPKTWETLIHKCGCGLSRSCMPSL